MKSLRRTRRKAAGLSRLARRSHLGSARLRGAGLTRVFRECDPVIPGTPPGGAGGYRTHDPGIMSRRRCIQVVPSGAIYQRFVRRSVPVLLPCGAQCRRICWMKCWNEPPRGSVTPLACPVVRAGRDRIGVPCSIRSTAFSWTSRLGAISLHVSPSADEGRLRGPCRSIRFDEPGTSKRLTGW
jgi:hypothetical protein